MPDKCCFACLTLQLAFYLAYQVQAYHLKTMILNTLVKKLPITSWSSGCVLNPVSRNSSSNTFGDINRPTCERLKSFEPRSQITKQQTVVRTWESNVKVTVQLVFGWVHEPLSFLCMCWSWRWTMLVFSTLFVWILSHIFKQLLIS